LEVIAMATQRQKSAARSNIKAAQSASHKAAPKRGNELRERDRNQLSTERFAFPAERKEPLTDASHVRNAIARFDQVEGVSDPERDRAWRRIRAAAKRYGVEIEVRGWRQLMAGRRS
jgi:hypothetical protein